MSFLRDNFKVIHASRRTLVLEIPEPLGYHGWSFKTIKVKLHLHRGAVEVFQWDPSLGKWVEPEPGVIMSLRELGDLLGPFKP